MKIQIKPFVLGRLFAPILGGVMFFILGWGSPVYAEPPTTVPHTFTPGALLLAAELNDNFSALSTAIDNVHLHVAMNGEDTAFGIGAHAMGSGEQNTAFGAYALSDIISAVGVTAIGHRALASNTEGISNTAVGDYALSGNTEGNYNTAVGRYALRSNETANDNTAVGFSALSNNTGEKNTAMGSYALTNNTTASNNTAVGYEALYSNTTGFSNTAHGVNALHNNTTGRANTAVGVGTLHHNITGDNNTAIGVNALVFNTGGFENTATGIDALSSNTTGALNTATGLEALWGNTTGWSNTSIGRRALFSNTTGSNNTAVGAGADVASNNLTNATAIGAGAMVNSSNTIRLGNTSVVAVYGPPYIVVSDKAQKENVKPVDGETVLKKLQGIPVSSWNYIGHDAKQFRHYGPMAQDFYVAFGQDGIGQIGTETTINSSDVAGILMVAVQELTQQNIALRANLDQIQAAHAVLEKANVELINRLAHLEQRINTSHEVAERIAR